MGCRLVTDSSAGLPLGAMVCRVSDATDTRAIWKQVPDAKWAGLSPKEIMARVVNGDGVDANRRSLDVLGHQATSIWGMIGIRTIGAVYSAPIALGEAAYGLVKGVTVDLPVAAYSVVTGEVGLGDVAAGMWQSAVSVVTGLKDGVVAMANGDVAQGSAIVVKNGVTLAAIASGTAAASRAFVNGARTVATHLANLTKGSGGGFAWSAAGSGATVTSGAVSADGTAVAAGHPVATATAGAMAMAMAAKTSRPNIVTGIFKTKKGFLDYLEKKGFNREEIEATLAEVFPRGTRTIHFAMIDQELGFCVTTDAGTTKWNFEVITVRSREMLYRQLVEPAEAEIGRRTAPSGTDPVRYEQGRIPDPQFVPRGREHER